MARAEDQTLPVRRVEIVTGDVTTGREQVTAIRGGTLLFPLGPRFAYICGELAAAAPPASFPNTAMSRRWGFARPDRSAAAYPAAYGQPPSRTYRH